MPLQVGQETNSSQLLSHNISGVSWGSDITKITSPLLVARDGLRDKMRRHHIASTGYATTAAHTNIHIFNGLLYKMVVILSS